MKYKYANPITIESLPVNRKIKNFFLRKYESLTIHNGMDYANEYFKSLRLTLMHILETRSWEKSQYMNMLHSSRLKVDYPTRVLIEMLKSQPHVVLHFLKFPSGNTLIKPNANEAYKSLKVELESSKDNCYPSDILDLASRTLKQSQKRARVPKAYNLMRPGFHDLLRPFKMGYMARKLEKDLTSSPVHPVLYKDAKQVDNVWSSPSYEKDRNDYLNQFNDFQNRDASITVGEIHLVAKGNDDYRAVATPNRFFQERLKPLETTLSEILRRSGVDASFNQSKFDETLMSWVNDPEIEPYGIDIHHATNYLPFGMSKVVIGNVLNAHSEELNKVDFVTPMKFRNGHVSNRKRNSLDIVNKSYDEFLLLSKSQWETPLGAVRFNRGQPLGLLGSFKTLTITNSFLCEMAIQLYEEHTGENLDADLQYVVLGDDVVFKHKLVGNYYIEILKQLDVPLSLHKSFHTNLVEFAGKAYIRNNGYHYLTDHHILTYNNVFDWQAATGVLIPWHNLSKELRNRFTREVERRNGKTLQLQPSVIYSRIAGMVTESTHIKKLDEWLLYFNVVNDVAHEVPRIAIDTATDAFPVFLDGKIVVQNTKISYYVRADSPIRRQIKNRSGRPWWKDTKYQIATTDSLVGRAVDSERWFQEDHRRGFSAYS